MDETLPAEATAEPAQPPEDMNELPVASESVAAAAPEVEPDTEDWGAQDIEEAYQKALRAMEELGGEPSSPEADADEGRFLTATTDTLAPAADAILQDAAVGDATSEPATQDAATSETVVQTPGRAASLRIAAGTEIDENLQRTQVTPKQVIEAALFVGGTPITARKLCSLLRGSFQPDAIEQLIDELNVEYSAQERPYEIRLGDGGYRLELRPEFDRLRQRVFGMGPREIRLSQEVLEVLAVVAYRQPITATEIEAVKPNAGNVLRQLIRRDLVGITRGERKRTDVTYHTTERFLSLFGLGSLNELPRPEDIAIK